MSIVVELIKKILVFLGLLNPTPKVKPYKEQFEEILKAKRAAGLVDIKPYFNLEGIAKHFGAKYVFEEQTLAETIDWSGTSYTADHTEVQEFMYKAMVDFMNAPSTRILNSTDMYGRVLDPKHPDFMTHDEQINNVLTNQKLNMGISKYEFALVLEGDMQARDGMTNVDYEIAWNEYRIGYEQKIGSKWPHPRHDQHEV